MPPTCTSKNGYNDKFYAYFTTINRRKQREGEKEREKEGKGEKEGSQ